MTEPESQAEAKTEAKTEGRKTRQGIEDRGGFGLLGLTAGIVGGFLVGFYVVVPAMLTKSSPLDAQTVVTVLTLVLMIAGGGAGYYFTRRPVVPKNGPAS